MSVSWIYEIHCVAFLRKDTMWDGACMRGPVITFCKHSTPSKRNFVTYCKLKLCNMILMNVIRKILFVVEEVTFSFVFLMKYERRLKMTPWYAYINGCVYYDSIMLYYCLITFWKLKWKMIHFVHNFVFFFANSKQVYIVLVHNWDMQVCVQLFSAGIFSFRFTPHTFILEEL